MNIVLIIMPSYRGRYFIPLSSLPFLEPFFVGVQKNHTVQVGRNLTLYVKATLQFFKKILYSRSS